MAGKPAAGRAYLAARQYQLAPGHTMEELAAVVESGFLPILRQVPGFLEVLPGRNGRGSYEGLSRVPASLRIRIGAEESTRRAADWVSQNLAGFFTGPPTVTIGSVWLHDGGGAMAGTPAP